jgi:hypothetical protein
MKKHAIKPLRQPDRIINYWKNDKPVAAFIIVFAWATILPPSWAPFIRAN